MEIGGEKRKMIQFLLDSEVKVKIRNDFIPHHYRILGERTMGT